MLRAIGTDIKVAQDSLRMRTARPHSTSTLMPFRSRSETPQRWRNF